MSFWDPLFSEAFAVSFGISIEQRAAKTLLIEAVCVWEEILPSYNSGLVDKRLF